MPYEDTGHCDMFAREGKGDVVFVSQMPSVAEFEGPGTTLTLRAKQVIQSQVDALERNAQRFKGKKVVRLKNAVAPTPAGEAPSEVRSYANSLVVNDVAFVPQYYDREERRAESVKKSDAEALKAYEKAGFKKVFGIDASAINKFKGSVHCISQTIPAEIDLAPLKGLALKSQSDRG
jgi:agmatine/peptidylarginine deiminase